MTDNLLGKIEGFDSKIADLQNESSVEASKFKDIMTEYINEIDSHTTINEGPAQVDNVMTEMAQAKADFTEMQEIHDQLSVIYQELQQMDL
jgi:archaellum component FlaC